MCSRKRSRPSSKRRLTKKLKRLSSGSSTCASAIGVVDEHRLRTNDPPPAAAAAVPSACAPAWVSAAKMGDAVIVSPERPVHRPRSLGTDEGGCGSPTGDHGSPAVIGIRPLDRWLCVPAFRRVCPFHYRVSVKLSPFPVKSEKCAVPLNWCHETATGGCAVPYVSRRASVPEASGALQMARVVAAAERRVGHREPRARCVDEAPVAGVDADVIDVPRVHAEEHQVTRGELLERHRPGGALLLERAARNGD